MSNQEHLLENAVSATENGKKDEFLNSRVNKEMSEETGIKLEDVLQMAQWVVYTYKPCVEQDVKDSLYKEYGYKI